jgi:hypothetical protein
MNLDKSKYDNSRFGIANDGQTLATSLTMDEFRIIETAALALTINKLDALREEEDHGLAYFEDLELHFPENKYAMAHRVLREGTEGWSSATIKIPTTVWVTTKVYDSPFAELRPRDIHVQTIKDEIKVRHAQAKAHKSNLEYEAARSPEKLEEACKYVLLTIGSICRTRNNDFLEMSPSARPQEVYRELKTWFHNNVHRMNTIYHIEYIKEAFDKCEDEAIALISKAQIKIASAPRRGHSRRFVDSGLSK